MISYSVVQGKDKIEFWTDNPELLEEVSRYIQTCVDAISWRNRIERLGRRLNNYEEEQIKERK